ncbi:MAG: hypothetical protein WEB58_00795 [Planctomycetaceae bacterium]
MAGNDQVKKHFALHYVGWFFSLAILALVVLVTWASVMTINHLANPPSFLDEYLNDKPNLHASMAVTLEYQSYALRVQGIQIAYGLMLSLIFVSIGMILFAVQAVGTIDFHTKMSDQTFGLKASSPGIASILLGAVIAMVTIHKGVGQEFSAGLQESGVGAMSTGKQIPPASGTSEIIDGKNNIDE